jgi:hypothetical protein
VLSGRDQPPQRGKNPNSPIFLPVLFWGLGTGTGGFFSPPSFSLSGGETREKKDGCCDKKNFFFFFFLVFSRSQNKPNFRKIPFFLLGKNSLILCMTFIIKERNQERLISKWIIWFIYFMLRSLSSVGEPRLSAMPRGAINHLKENIF